MNIELYIYHIQSIVKNQLRDSNGNYITTIPIWIFQLRLYSALDKLEGHIDLKGA